MREAKLGDVKTASREHRARHALLPKRVLYINKVHHGTVTSLVNEIAKDLTAIVWTARDERLGCGLSEDVV